MIRSFAAGLAGVLSCWTLPAGAEGGTAWPTLTGERPLVIGHRGASGTLPEHTLESYRLAIAQGADFIEPDLVSSADGVLVARHEPNITTTTDVRSRPEFADRYTTKTIDGRAESGWFAEDFTLAELKTLRVMQPMPFRDQSHNHRYEIPTLQEVIELALAESSRLGRSIGIYPETKHPSYFRALNLGLEERLVALLEANGVNSREAPVFIQSFEVSNLTRLAAMTPVRLIQLIGGFGPEPGGRVVAQRPYDFVLSGDARTYADLIKPEGLRELARYASGIGPWKQWLVAPPSALPFPANAASPSRLVADAHAVRLLVHPYTFRNEAQFLGPEYAGNPAAEYRRFYEMGVDGVFTDFPDAAVDARH